MARSDLQSSGSAKHLGPSGLTGRRGRLGYGLIGWVILLLFGGASEAACEGPADAGELVGDWYVLVHYQDSQGADPRQIFWQDEVWRFAPAPGGVRWTRYPHAVFNEGAGRTARLPSGEQGQSLGAWWPNTKQRAEIEAGLPLDSFEAKSKRLFGQPGGGYRSRSLAQGGSASSVAFVAHWSIEPAPSGPVFRQRDTLASGRAESAQGEAVFRTESRAESGDSMGGVFRRDGRFEGKFWLWRSPSPKGPPVP
ncbi:MAG: hypothetical protein P8M78_11145 [Myxococcota bacterium]|nr:hypothetical protein [Myxococcota bacterium]